MGFFNFNIRSKHKNPDGSEAKLEDKNNNGSNIDEIAAKMLKNGKVGKEDAQEINDLSEAFKNDAEGKLSHTKNALKEMMIPMLEKGYDVRGATQAEQLQKIFKIAGIDFDIKAIYETNKKLLSGEYTSSQGYAGYEGQEVTVPGVDPFSKTFVFKLNGEILEIHEHDKNDAGSKGSDKIGDVKLGESVITESSTWNGRTDDRVADNNKIEGNVEDNISDIKSALDKDIQSHNNDIQSEKIIALEKKLGGIGTHVSENAEKIGSIGTYVSKNAEKIGSIGVIIEKIKTDIGNINKQITALKESDAALEKDQTRQDEVTESNKTAQDQINGESASEMLEIKNQLKALSDRIADVNEYIRELESELDSRDSNYKDKFAEIEALKSTVKDLSASMVSINEKINTLESKSKAKPEENFQKIPEGGPLADSPKEGKVSLPDIDAPLVTDSEALKKAREGLDKNATTSVPEKLPDFSIGDAEIMLNNSLSSSALGEMDAPEKITQSKILNTLKSYLENPELATYEIGSYKTFWGSKEGYKMAYAMQAALAHLGHNPVWIDGVWGDKSQAALISLGGVGKNPGPESIGKLISLLESGNVDAPEEILPNRKFTKEEFVTFSKLFAEGKIDEAKDLAKTVNTDFYNNIKELDTSEIQETMENMKSKIMKQMESIIDEKTGEMRDDFVLQKATENLPAMTFGDIRKLGDMQVAGNFDGLFDIEFFSQMHKLLNDNLKKSIESGEIKEFTKENIQVKMQELFAKGSDMGALPKEFAERITNVMNLIADTMLPFLQDGKITREEFKEMLQALFDVQKKIIPPVEGVVNT